ncbi:MAG: DUF1440 domain-containing protein [Bryobacteraceae bacterium]
MREILGGLTGSYAMNQFQSLWSIASRILSSHQNQKLSAESEDAVVKTAKAISKAIFRHELTDSEKRWAGLAVHYSFGTALGALYGVLADTFPASRASHGTAYGSAVWLGADEISVPAFGLSAPPTATPASSHLSALASHVVYGFVTDLVRRVTLSQMK